MSVDLDNFKKVGRKLQLCNSDILNTLRAVYTNHEPLSPTDIARLSKGDTPNIKKFSNEFKIIKKLCPSFKELPDISDMRARRFLKVTLKQNVEKALSEADKEYKQAEHNLQRAARVSESPNIIIPSNVESKITIIKDRYHHAEQRLFEIKNRIEKRGRKDWRYSPIFRGLLLYLYNEVVDWGKDSTNWKRRESKKYIRRVISNPLVIEEAPFLHHWKVFEEHGFDVVGLLKQIAVELYNQLHITAENDNYLLRRATERYFSEIEIHLEFSLFFIKKNGLEKYNELVQRRNEYQKNIVALKRMWIAEELKEITFYETKHKEFDFEQEIHKIIRNVIDNHNSVINIDEVAQRYEISTYNALNLLLPSRPHDYYNSDKQYYYEYKGKRYLITNPCLILDSKAEDLKLLLIEGNNNKMITRCSQAFSLLASNGIPKDCHSELIKRLGFNFIRENERGEYDSSDPLIVHKGVNAFKEFFNSVEYYPLVRQNFD